MAKPKKQQIPSQPEISPQKSQPTMTLEEAKAYRASLHKPQVKALSDVQKREAFRVFWTSQKAKYGQSKKIEKAIWLHLKSINMDSPDKFSEGLANFGLKKVK